MDEKELQEIIKIAFPIMAAAKIGNDRLACDLAEEAKKKGVIVEM